MRHRLVWITIRFPLDVRIRSRTTVNDCVIRADKEGWPIEYKQKVWVDAVSGCYLWAVTKPVPVPVRLVKAENDMVKVININGIY